MEAPRSRLPRVLIALSVLAVLVAVTVAGTLISWNRDRRAAIEFTCDGTVATFTPENEYDPPVLVVRNEDGSIVTLESRALALTDLDAPSGARIVKQRGAPDVEVNGKPMTFVRDR